MILCVSFFLAVSESGESIVFLGAPSGLNEDVQADFLVKLSTGSGDFGASLAYVIVQSPTFLHSLLYVPLTDTLLLISLETLYDFLSWLTFHLLKQFIISYKC